VKTDRFSSVSTLAAAVLLACLLLSAAHPSNGLQMVKVTYESSPKQLAMMLAFEVAEVQKTFDENRRALRTVQGADGKPAYLRQEVAGLITRTEQDLDQAIERVGELDALRAWAAEEFRLIWGELELSSRTDASLRGLPAPRAVAVVAGLGPLSPPRFTGGGSATPRQEAIPAEMSNSLLNQVREVISRIWFLGDRKDLEVELWVGSAPAPKATFSFWSEGKIKNAEPRRIVLQTNGKPDRPVLRGLYAYEATFDQQVIHYPAPTGAPAAQLIQGLDLVKGSGFFCCRFNNQPFCHHVRNPKECH